MEVFECSFDWKSRSWIGIPLEENQTAYKRSGHYLIYTTATLDLFKELPTRIDTKRYDFASRAINYENAKYIKRPKIEDGWLPVYNGIATYSLGSHHLIARLKQHIIGSDGTGSLAFAHDDYLAVLKNTKWKVKVEAWHQEDITKIDLRFIESKWRSDHGWPALCSE